MVSETLAQGRVVYRAGSMIVSTAATFVVLTGIISAPALLVGFTPGPPLEGPALPALELGWFPPGPSGTSASVAGGTAGPATPARPADVLAGSPAARSEVSTLQPADQPQQHAAAGPPPAAPVVEQPPVLSALPDAAEVVEEIIASPNVADAQPAPGAVVLQPDEQDTVAANEDHGETDLVAEGNDADEQTDGTDQNSPWLDTDEPTGLLNLLLGDESARPLK